MASRPQPSSSSRSSPPGPKTIKLKANALLSLPYRLTHPPPPQPKSSTWGITPHFRIPLHEILDRKHLPPLGLKDFEEWLLYIDRTPECLYFILWLREYKSRYTAWRRQSKPSSPIRCSSNPLARTYRSLCAPPPPNPGLTQFYLRAKETFLTPYAPYALPVPLDLLAPFYSSSDVPGPRSPDHLLLVPGQPPPPPYPEIFEEVEERVIAMLSESLDRFVLATFHNVGMPRAYCGCAGGTVIGLTGSAPILIANFLTGGSRWWRFCALPGLWLGMTIVISAMYGVCMMIYVFGDLRQLRSFELARVPGTDQPPLTSTKAPEERKPRKSLFGHVFPRRPEQAKVPNIEPVTGPHASVSHATSQEFSVRQYTLSDASSSPVTRPIPARLQLDTPASSQAYTHFQASPRAYSSHVHMQSMSSASTSYSMKFERAGCYNSPYDAEDDYSASGSDYESDYDSGSESDASSDASHEPGTHDEMNLTQSGVAKHAPQPRRRRRRRREPEIHISDAIFDEDPSPEGPAMGESRERRRSSVWGESTEEDLPGMGATFIHPFRWSQLDESLCTHDIESQAYCAAEHQRIDAFDFNGLPPRAPKQMRSSDSVATPLPPPMASTFVAANSFPHATAVDPEKHSRGVHFASDVERRARKASEPRPLGPREAEPTLLNKFLGILQVKCGPRNVAMYLLGQHGSVESTVAGSEGVSDLPTQTHASLSVGGPISPSSTLAPPSVVWPTSPVSEKGVPPPAKTKIRTTWQQRMRRMLQVPAFASPLTPVLNPVVTRGQWEIVVRSAVIAIILSAVVIGALVAVPQTHV